MSISLHWIDLKTTWFIVTVYPPVASLTDVHALAVGAVELVLGTGIQAEDQHWCIGVLLSQTVLVLSDQGPLAVAERIFEGVSCGVDALFAVDLWGKNVSNIVILFEDMHNAYLKSPSLGSFLVEQDWSCVSSEEMSPADEIRVAVVTVPHPTEFAVKAGVFA